MMAATAEPTAFLLLNPEGKIMGFNAGASRVLQMADTAVLGQQFAQLVAESDRTTAEEWWTQGGSKASPPLHLDEVSGMFRLVAHGQVGPDRCQVTLEPADQSEPKPTRSASPTPTHFNKEGLKLWTKTLNGCLRTDEVYALTRAAAPLILGRNGALWRLTPGDLRLQCVCSWGNEPVNIEGEWEADDSWALRTGQAVSICDLGVAGADPFIARQADEDAVTVPLVARAKVWGVIGLVGKAEPGFSPFERHRLVQFASEIAQVLSRLES
jgi:hypothetical protein